mmetsp:Transcript_30317/g.54903  ORF Transcript_30317/g.54903 Transcript_30317/m.54903 type:complete len:308 (+) Transcript_30317:413-1336(+)
MRNKERTNAIIKGRSFDDPLTLDFAMKFQCQNEEECHFNSVGRTFLGWIDGIQECADRGGAESLLSQQGGDPIRFNIFRTFGEYFLDDAGCFFPSNGACDGLGIVDFAGFVSVYVVGREHLFASCFVGYIVGIEHCAPLLHCLLVILADTFLLRHTLHHYITCPNHTMNINLIRFPRCHNLLLLLRSKTLHEHLNLIPSCHGDLSVPLFIFCTTTSNEHTPIGNIGRVFFYCLLECKYRPLFCGWYHLECLFLFVIYTDVHFGKTSIVATTGGRGGVGAFFILAGDTSSTGGGGFERGGGESWWIRA